MLVPSPGFVDLVRMTKPSHAQRLQRRVNVDFTLALDAEHQGSQDKAEWNLERWEERK